LISTFSREACIELRNDVLLAMEIAKTVAWRVDDIYETP